MHKKKMFVISIFLLTMKCAISPSEDLCVVASNSDETNLPIVQLQEFVKNLELEAATQVTNYNTAQKLQYYKDTIALVKNTLNGDGLTTINNFILWFNANLYRLKNYVERTQEFQQKNLQNFVRTKVAVKQSFR